MDSTPRRSLAPSMTPVTPATSARDSFGLLPEAIESLDEGFIMYDADDRLVVCNQRYRELYPIGAERLVPGVRYLDLLMNAVAEGAYRDTGLSAEAWVADRLLAHRRPGHREHPRGDRVIRVSNRVTPNGCVVSLRTDVTDLRRGEAAVRAQKAAEAASRAKSEFLARMSHEVRTPLNGVIGMTELLLTTALSPEQRDYAETARGAGEALLTIVNNILDFSKIEADRVELERVDFDPRQLVADLRALFSGAARRSGVALRAEIDPGLPSAVRGDPGRLRQVLTNLIANALKFTSAGEVVVRARPDGDALRFEVADTGIGVAPDAQGRLFQPFAQAEASTARRFGGTGLGLAICKEVVALLGGDIGMESEPGRGSTFWFTARLPAAVARAAPTPSRAPTKFPEALRVRVLLVEDNPVNRKLASCLLAKRGCHVDAAADGREAIEAAARGGYDLVLMDCQMPGVDGYEATRAIRAAERASGQARTTIVAMTAHAVAGAREVCLDAGMDDYLTKPIVLADFDRVLAERVLTSRG